MNLFVALLIICPLVNDFPLLGACMVAKSNATYETIAECDIERVAKHDTLVEKFEGKMKQDTYLASRCVDTDSPKDLNGFMMSPGGDITHTKIYPNDEDA